eukprot:187670-Pelagomonas_calceolata.AAC.1
MRIEECALPFFKKAGFQPASICTAARTNIECACHQISNPGSLEPVNSEPPYLDMNMFVTLVMSANKLITGNAY